jgi:hypothetical protein
MEHRVVIERLFSLGSYQNIKIIAETSNISDDIWNDADQLKTVRDGLEQEILASYAQHMTLFLENREKIQSGKFEDIYKENA